MKKKNVSCRERLDQMQPLLLLPLTMQYDRRNLPIWVSALTEKGQDSIGNWNEIFSLSFLSSLLKYLFTSFGPGIEHRLNNADTVKSITCLREFYHIGFGSRTSE